MTVRQDRSTRTSLSAVATMPPARPPLIRGRIAGWLAVPPLAAPRSIHAPDAEAMMRRRSGEARAGRLLPSGM